MTEMTYTTVDRVLSKFHRDLRGAEINESDAIEWIGEALGFLQVYQVQEEAVAFLEVKRLIGFELTSCHAELDSASKQIPKRVRNDISGYPIIIPAIVADKSEAKLPPITAFSPNSDNVLRWFGAKEPIPPI